MNNEIKVLDLRIGEIRKLREKKEALKKRMNVIGQLQRSRNVGTQVLDEMAKIIPPGIYLTKLEKQGNSILLMGKSESNNHLSNLIREIESSEFLTSPVLESIVSSAESPRLLSDFYLRLRIKGLDNDVVTADGDVATGTK